MYLKLAWNRQPISSESDLFIQILEPTAELYRERGYAAMDEGILEAWLIFAWSGWGVEKHTMVEEAMLKFSSGWRQNRDGVPRDGRNCCG